MINTDDLTPLYRLENLEELSICGDNADVSGLSALESLKKLTIQNHMPDLNSIQTLEERMPELVIDLPGTAGI